MAKRNFFCIVCVATAVALDACTYFEAVCPSFISCGRHSLLTLKSSKSVKKSKVYVVAYSRKEVLFTAE